MHDTLNEDDDFFFWLLQISSIKNAHYHANITLVSTTCSPHGYSITRELISCIKKIQLQFISKEFWTGGICTGQIKE